MNWAKIRHFLPHELADPSTGKEDMNLEFMLRLDELRDFCAHPLIVTSGFRGPDHNRHVGGAPYSAHLIGRAADIRIRGQRAFLLVQHAMRLGFSGIGVARNFVHLDDAPANEHRDRPMLWTYGKAKKR